MHNEIIYDTLLTGDLILFSCNNSIISSIVKMTTSSIWTHVGIVVKDPDFLMNIQGEKKGLYLLNSDGSYEKDIETDTYHTGVQLVDLKKKIDNYEGLIVVRHLLTTNMKHDDDENKRRNKMFKSAYQSVFEKSYDYIPLNLLVSYLHNSGYVFADNMINCRHTDYLYCSALVAYLYTVTGILDKNTKWSLCVPAFFASEHTTTIDMGMYNLSPMLVLKDTINHINSNNCHDESDEPYIEGSEHSSEDEICENNNTDDEIESIIQKYTDEIIIQKELETEKVKEEKTSYINSLCILL
jgi:hypothetical protein